MSQASQAAAVVELGDDKPTWTTPGGETIEEGAVGAVSAEPASEDSGVEE